MRILFALLLFVIPAFGQSGLRDPAFLASVRPAASYNPSNDLTGMILWLNPDTQPEVDGAQIVTYLDRSGKGNDLTQIENTVRRPVRKTGIINGKATVRTDTVSGMYHDSFNMPADVAIFWGMSNLVSSGSLFNHDSHWFVQFGDNRLYNFDFVSNLGQKRIQSGFHTYSFICTNGGQIFWEDGVPLQGLGASKSAGNGRLMLFANQAYSYDPASDYGEFLVYSNSTMTSSRRVQIEQYLCLKYGRTHGQGDGKIRIVCDGDSITAGTGINTEPGGDDSWPARLRGGLGSAYESVNLGVSGQDLLTISNDAPVQVFPFHGNGTNILFLWEYINSTSLGITGTHDAISNYCKSARAAGWTKILAGSDFHINTTANGAGDLVRTNWAGFADAFVELDLQSLRDDSAMIDNIHLSTVGWQIVANAVSNVIKTAFYP